MVFTDFSVASDADSAIAQWRQPVLSLFTGTDCALDCRFWRVHSYFGSGVNILLVSFNLAKPVKAFDFDTHLPNGERQGRHALYLSSLTAGVFRVEHVKRPRRRVNVSVVDKDIDQLAHLEQDRIGPGD
jgi:hypothetical protein